MGQYLQKYFLGMKHYPFRTTKKKKKKGQGRETNKRASSGAREEIKFRWVLVNVMGIRNNQDSSQIHL